VKEVDAKGAVINLFEDIDGTLKASEISRDRVEDARNALKVGDEVETKITNVDRKNRAIVLSIKAKDHDDEKSAVKDHASKQDELSTPSTIGDLIKAQMESKG
jgi:small subunit ribosomal protein S1